MLTHDILCSTLGEAGLKTERSNTFNCLAEHVVRGVLFEVLHQHECHECRKCVNQIHSMDSHPQKHLHGRCHSDLLIRLFTV